MLDVMLWHDFWRRLGLFINVVVIHVSQPLCIIVSERRILQGVAWIRSGVIKRALARWLNKMTHRLASWSALPTPHNHWQCFRIGRETLLSDRLLHAGWLQIGIQRQLHQCAGRVCYGYVHDISSIPSIISNDNIRASPVYCDPRASANACSCKLSEI